MGYGLGSTVAKGKAALRTIVVASVDVAFRARVSQELTSMRWQVREAGGGAEAFAQLEAGGAEAMVLDSTLPDLDVGEFVQHIRTRHPAMDLLRVNAPIEEAGARSPRRNEILHALREAQKDEVLADRTDIVAWKLAPVAAPQASAGERLAPAGPRSIAALEVAEMLRSRSHASNHNDRPLDGINGSSPKVAPPDIAPPAATITQTLLRIQPLPEMVGASLGMLEMARMVRLVAPRSTSVLIQGDTGTGKELVAKAIHLLSARSAKLFLVLNCAAIPEALLEAELFGHTRGAFTGAVQSRTGRIEAANGGTLFLDEIGEMPLALQAKMLRFLESGELQRVGDNETLKVDVRIVAASHQPLLLRSSEGTFRLDLYHRLAVFPVKIPALRERMEDVIPLADYLLARLGKEWPMKRLSKGAAAALMEYDWPGNVRELAHVLERGAILAEDRWEITRAEILF